MIFDLNLVEETLEETMLKNKVDFKIYDVTTWKTITIHILPSMSKSKGNQTMKFGQLMSIT